MRFRKAESWGSRLIKGTGNITTENWQYDAFISYRHMEPDGFVAQTLHRYLESFKLPGSVVRQKEEERSRGRHENAQQDRAGIKTRIHRVFRDREELPLVSNLADPITEALEQSEFLIVICSPRLNESMWCRKEIETFIRMHDREHVLAVLVEGEPETSFPEELLYREEEVRQDDGSVIYKRVPVEPLAADVRGGTRRQIRRKIKNELLRLAAPMFACNYDDLRQRHKEQKMRKTILTSVSVSAMCLLIGLVSTIMAWKIQYQSRQIEEGAQMIYEQSQMISAQNQELLDTITVAQAREALTFLEEGDRLLGLAEGMVAFDNWCPDDIRAEGDTEKCPSQLTYAMTELLYLYENGEQIKPDRVVENASTIRFMKLSPEGSRLMVVGDSGNLAVWKSKDDSMKVFGSPEGVNLSWESQVGFLSEKQILYPQEDMLCVQDLETQETRTYACNDYQGVIPIPDAASFIVVEEEGCCLVGADGEESVRVPWNQLEEGLYAKPGFESAQVVTEDGRILAALELNGTEKSDEGPADTEGAEAAGRDVKRIAVLEYTRDGVKGGDGGEPVVTLYPMEYEYIGSLCLEDGRYRQGAELLYVTSNRSEKTDSSVTTAGMRGRLQAFDLSGQSQLWSYDVEGAWLYEVDFTHSEDSSYLLCQKYSDAMLFDRRDGSLIDTFSFGSEVVRTGSYTGTDDFMAFTRDGTWHYLHTGRMEDMIGRTFSDCTSSNVKDFAMGDGYCVTLPYGSNRATIYRTARGAGLESFHEGEGYYRAANLSTDGALLAAARYDDGSNTCVELFGTAQKKLLWTYKDKAYYESMAFGDFDGDGTTSLLVVTKDAYHMIDLADGSVVSTVDFENDFLEYLGLDEKNGVLYLKDYHTLYGYGLADGELLYQDELPDGITAVCHEQPFYAVASSETDSLLFYQMGETEVFMDPKSQGIGVEYLETMFFDEDDDDLYLVYKDGRVVIYFVDWDADQDVYFCGGHGNFKGLSEKMARYERPADADFGFLCGTNDAYQIDLREGRMYDKLSHIHGYLAYDPESETLYLYSGKGIYTSPLYSMAEITDLAGEVLNSSHQYWNYQEFVPYYLEEIGETD